MRLAEEGRLQLTDRVFGPKGLSQCETVKGSLRIIIKIFRAIFIILQGETWLQVELIINFRSSVRVLSYSRRG